ncbi:MAG: hypothetical protein A3H27_03430 [Acidobacteria bacterium RIFCSPLOWO2_02_FULL_59_13]|nr:MAG: hypothetical protein A3H27_03430 [Acidobacteria bacterium RIFCSPLOWO2_02_FULL_59_13]
MSNCKETRQRKEAWNDYREKGERLLQQEIRWLLHYCRGSDDVAKIFHVFPERDARTGLKNA